MKVPETRNEWIEFLVSKRAVPIWDKDVEGNVYFRRLEGPTIIGDKHIIGKETRKHAAKVLGIITKEECRMIRELVKKKIMSSRAS